MRARGRVRLGVSIHAPTGGATHDLHRGHGPRGFNSRAHGGRDASRARHPGRPRVSIHAPTGGATMPFRAYNLIYNVSIHAPTGDATRLCGRERNLRRRFNSRAHGGRDIAKREKAIVEMFQFTRPRGARRQNRLSYSSPVSFNSRAHGGRDIPGHAVSAL